MYLAHDLKHGRPVALKVLDPAVAGTVGPDRFLREVSIAAQLQHPLICPVLDSDVTRAPGVPPLYWYTMPYIDGESLRDRLNREGRLPLGEALSIAREAAEALQFAHHRGVIHRDVKPENILLTGGHALVTDFGIAKALTGSREDGDRPVGHVTAAGVIVGTPAYMSPEQASGEEEVDPRSDIYSLGCVTFEMLAGEPAFAGSSVQAILIKRVLTDPPSLATRSGVPRPVAAAVMRAMARSPEDRFRTAAEFADALEGGRPRWTPRRAVVIAAVIIGIVLGVIGWLAIRRANEPPPVATLAIRPLAATDSATQYLSDGIHDAVTDLLRRLPQLSVAAPSLVAQVVAREPNLDIQELGRRLGVGSVLTWSLRRIGDSVQVRAELVETTGGRLLWGESFNRSVAGVLSIQNEIARAISDSLRLKLTGADLANLARRPTSDPEAWDLYLRGRRFYARASILGGPNARADADSALHYGRESLRRDPDLAGGHLLVSNYYALSAIRGWREPFGALMDSALTMTRHAIALDSAFADAWVDLGGHFFSFTDDWARAGSFLARGVTLDPDYANGQLLYGLYLAEVRGELDSGLVHVRRAAQLEETPHILNSLGDLLMRARRWDSAVVVLRRALALAPGAPGPWNRLLRSLEEQSRFQEAVALRRTGPDSASAEEFAVALARGGPTGYRRTLEADLRGRIDSLMAALAGRPNFLADEVPPLREHRIAQLYARLGDRTAAMEWIQREYRRRPGRFRLAVVDPDFALIRGEPRFVELVRREGLESLAAGRR